MTYFNIHTHRKPEKNEFIIRNGFVPNSISQINNLPYCISIGVHPWFTNRYDINKAEQKLAALLSSPKVLAIGEIGLDKFKGEAISTQIKWFEMQLNLAQTFQKLVIVHCVKALHLILPLIKKHNIPWVFHGFSGNNQMADSIFNANGHVSVGAQLLTKPALQKVVLNIDSQKLLLETDVSPIHIQEVYQKTASILNLNMEELSALIKNNFNRFLNSSF